MKVKVSDLPIQARFRTLLTLREGYIAQKKPDAVLVVFSDEEKWVSPELKVEKVEEQGEEIVPKAVYLLSRGRSERWRF